ncbi:MAG TPA: PQQ-binding-like beta-propeller repeat protein [Thermoanaerobaculia bacterium]|nr:PQQ-binding-like beta-propeller repeat protein [Thermoanaerobaculia bacterium]
MSERHPSLRSRTGSRPGAPPGAPAILALLVLLVLLPSVELGAQDWSQWRGPSRDGVAADFEPPAVWPDQLALTWQAEVGPGNASPVVAGGRAFAFVRDGESESLVALDVASGEVLWRNGYVQEFTPLTVVGRHDKGPFATPTVRDGRVFTLGIRERLVAWSADSGEILWQRGFDQDFKRPQPFYGTSQSPLALADRVIVHLGGPGEGALQAFDPATGEDLWRAPTEDGPAYGSPVLAELAGRTQVVTFTQRRLIGFDPADGAVLWELPYQVSFDAASVTPVIHGDLIIVGSEQRPVEAYRVRVQDEGLAVEGAWTAKDVAFQFSSPVLVSGRLFGFSVRNKGQVVALDPDSGAVLWSGPPRQGENAYLIGAGPVVLVFRDDAGLEVIAAAAEGHTVLATYAVGESWSWSHPAVLGHALLVKDYDVLRRWELVPPSSP